MQLKGLCLAICLYLAALDSMGQSGVLPLSTPKTYTSSDGKSIFVPLGRVAFPDSVVTFKRGNPAAQKPFDNPQNSLGEPDFTTYRTPRPKYVSIGCGGSLTLMFKNAGFMDIEGSDLVFFEIGPSVEPFSLEISPDGKKWYKLGQIRGGTSLVDIAGFVRPTDPPLVYQYIRITDLLHFCDGPTPGSDIDAIGALGAVLKYTISGETFYDSDEYQIHPLARRELLNLLHQMQGISTARIQIDGHTDSDGGKQYNLTLGERRAKAVKFFLQSQLEGKGNYRFETRSYGMSQPRQSNAEESGKKINRRVEIVVFPDKSYYRAKD